MKIWNLACLGLFLCLLPQLGNAEPSKYTVAQATLRCDVCRALVNELSRAAKNDYVQLVTNSPSSSKSSPSVDKAKHPIRHQISSVMLRFTERFRSLWLSATTGKQWAPPLSTACFPIESEKCRNEMLQTIREFVRFHNLESLCPPDLDKNGDKVVVSYHHDFPRFIVLALQHVAMDYSWPEEDELSLQDNPNEIYHERLIYQRGFAGSRREENKVNQRSDAKIYEKDHQSGLFPLRELTSAQALLCERLKNMSGIDICRSNPVEDATQNVKESTDFVLNSKLALHLEAASAAFVYVRSLSLPEVDPTVAARQATDWFGPAISWLEFAICCNDDSCLLASDAGKAHCRRRLVDANEEALWDFAANFVALYEQERSRCPGLQQAENGDL